MPHSSAISLSCSHYTVMKKFISLTTFSILIMVLIALAPTAIYAQTKAAPETTKLSISTDLLSGGARVLITGKNFTADSRITLGDSAVTDFMLKGTRKI